MPPCVAADAVNTVRVTAQGDFPPETMLTAAASPSMPATLTLPAATRAIDVEGFGPTGLAAFGRTPTLALGGVAAGPFPIAYGPPDSACVTGGMLVARAGHHATALSGGGVLVTGGVGADDGAVTQVELYDAKTASFGLTGASLDPHAALAHATAPLSDGGALVTGGVGADPNGLPSGFAVAGALRFDAAGKLVGSPLLLAGGAGRAGHAAIALADGRVLLAGGCQDFDAGACVPGASLASTEIYDAKSDSFAAGPPLASARVGGAAVLLGDGTVLLVGGRGEGGGAVPAEVVDPDEERGFQAGVASGAGAGLPTGSVLVAGGTTTAEVTMALWLSATEMPLALPSLAAPRLGPTLTPLADGSVLVAGGGDATLALFDGRAGVTTLAASFHANNLAAAALADGTVLLTGGADAGGPTADAAVFFHSPLSPWASLPPLTLDGSDDPYLPRRPDRAAVDSGQLVVSAAAPSTDGRPAELALVAGMEVADFTFDLLGGRRGDAGAALVVGWQSDAAYAFVVVAPDRAVELWSVSSPRTGQTVAAPVAGCSGATLPDAALPDGALAALEVAWRGGTLHVTAGGVTMLQCRPPALPRGAVGVAALSGTVAFDNLALTR